MAQLQLMHSLLGDQTLNMRFGCENQWDRLGAHRSVDVDCGGRWLCGIGLGWIYGIGMSGHGRIVWHVHDAWAMGHGGETRGPGTAEDTLY